MKPIEEKAYRCANCDRMYGSQNVAENCCVCSECGSVSEDKGHLCDKCWRMRAEGIERQRLEKATIVEQYDGWIFCGEEYYQDMDDMRDSYDGDALPEFVFCCTENHIALNVDQIIEDAVSNQLGDTEEDMSDQLSGVEELREAVAKFNAANVRVVTYEVDYKRKVRVERK